MPEHVLLSIHTADCPLRREPQRERDMDIPGTAPLRIVHTDEWGIQERFQISFEGTVIGTAGLRFHGGAADRPGDAHPPRYDVIVNLNTKVPERIVEPILSRMQAFAREIHRMHQDKKAEERRVMQEMLDVIGPVDHAKVRVPYAPGAAGISALTFPGVLNEILGPRFSYRQEPTSDRTEMIGFHYTDAGVSYPAFRVSSAYGGATEIRGRGERERAREAFVSDAMERALAHVHRIASDPEMRAAAALLPDPEKPWGAMKSHYERCSDRDAFSANRAMIARPGGNIVETASEPFGEGFEAVVFSDYSGDFEIRFEGKTLKSKHDGFLPGIPEDLRARIYQAAVLTLLGRRPDFATHNADLRARVGTPARETDHKDTFTPRILAAFGAPQEMEP